MTILQAGMAKSGNTWIFKILKHAIGMSTGDHRSFIEQHPIHEIAREWELSHEHQDETDVLDITSQGLYWRIGSVFRKPLDDLDAFLARTDHVWTHSLACERTADVLDRFDGIVYLVRDPRDVAISRAKFFFTPYMQRFYPSDFEDPAEALDDSVVEMCDRWTRHVAGYLALLDETPMHVVFYERLLYDTLGELERLNEALGFGLGREQLEEIERRTSFETMKADNPEHVRKGRARQWIETMDDGQKRRALDTAGPMLELLNYPTDLDPARHASSPADLPRVPEALDPDELETAARAARRTRLFQQEIVDRIEDAFDGWLDDPFSG